MVTIQGVPRGEVNILWGHSVGHSKLKMNVHVSYFERFRERAISLNSSKNNDKKEILRTVSNTGIYCSSDKVGTVYLV
jgi:predicted transport protein